MTGGYSQQGYQAQPPTSWAPPVQQPGYGYVQPGSYPGPTPQYNVPQQPYPGYPSQPTSGGYATGWDQTTGAPNQQTSQGGGYDYYSQQPQQQQAPPGPAAAAADNSSYDYTQPPASAYNPQGQGYPQDGYGGYNAPAAPQSGYANYDQQQGYGGGQGDTSQTPQGYATNQQPSPNPASYPSQGSAQPGYGVPISQTAYGTQPPSGYGGNYGPPQAQKPAYGQPQQSPVAQGGYGQPGYPHSQVPPAQVGPPSSYGTATAPGYGAPPYGAPPVAQPGYGQQQPPYNSSYGSGYSSQPPAYSADGNTTPTAQAVQPGGVAKASPQS